ncbi:DUF6328 family protein [Solihabitans fulvus]|uniref:DUF6328 family protein n=1 Tax=Solihabitans fulvus TaxID=1892852 RepID=UPI001CB75FCC|nr:DUF6328 family protein [Solihabitans fulvus]
MSPHSNHLPHPHDSWNYAARGETPTQRLDRNYGEILQEVRVAQTGVQLLLAFLFTLAFTPRFTALTDFQRGVYVTSLILGAAATALLIAPAPFHRVVFARRLKRLLVRASGLFAVFGLALLMLSLSSALLLILDVVLNIALAAWIASGTLLWFCTWWYAVPLWSRMRHGRDAAEWEPAAETAPPVAPIRPTTDRQAG